MTAVRARNIAWLCFGLTIVSIPISTFMLTRPLRTPLTTQDAWSLFGAVTGAVAFSLVGALILSRHPRHAIGWTFTLSGLATSAALLCAGYGELSDAPGWSLPGGQVVGDVGYILLQSGVFIPLTLGLLLFPDGRLLSRRWWPAAAASVVGLMLRLISDLVQNPLWDPINNVGILLTVCSTIAGLASLTLRWRTADSILRQQLKWMTAAASLVVVGFVVDIAITIWNDNLIKPYEFLLFITAYVSIPLAAGAAILRYGLYEIDFIINRAIVYVALTAIVGGLYAGLTATLQKVSFALTGANTDATIVITVALIATLVTPVRNSLQRIVDRRFKDAKDLERLLSSLETEVGAVIDVIYGPRLAERLVKTAREGSGATGAAVFLNGTSIATPSYTAGEWTGEAELVVPMRAGQTELGRIALSARRHGAPYTEKERARLQRAADMVAMGLTLARDNPAAEPLAT